MISRWLLLTVLVVFTPGLLPGQTPGPIAPTTGAASRDASAAPGNFDQPKMYEDIEIFRRILDRKLTPLYPSVLSKGERTDAFDPGTLSGTIDDATGSVWVAPEALNLNPFSAGQGTKDPNKTFLYYSTLMPHPAAIPFRSLEGVYLTGQGVVYTATVSSLQLPAKAEANSGGRWRVAITQPDSEWDSIRRQVRNEKEKPKKLEESKPPSLKDVLLQVLAENGRHFSQLGENENLMIIVTVREPSAPMPAAKPATGSATTQSNPYIAVSEADPQRDAANLGMLGEFHLKQAKYGEAISVFEKLLSRAKTPDQEAQVRRKLAQCYLGLGQDDKVRVELDKAIELQKQLKEGKAKPTSAKPTTLPTKLIVWAPKKLLDQAEKITFEEFRRQASVEVLRFGDRR